MNEEENLALQKRAISERNLALLERLKTASEEAILKAVNEGAFRPQPSIYQHPLTLLAALLCDAELETPEEALDHLQQVMVLGKILIRQGFEVSGLGEILVMTDGELRLSRMQAQTLLVQNTTDFELEQRGVIEAAQLQLILRGYPQRIYDPAGKMIGRFYGLKETNLAVSGSPWPVTYRPQIVVHQHLFDQFADLETVMKSSFEEIRQYVLQGKAQKKVEG